MPVAGGVLGGASVRRLAPEASAMAYPYQVYLTAEERAELRGLVGSGTAPTRMLTGARSVSVSVTAYFVFHMQSLRSGWDIVSGHTLSSRS